MSVALTSVPVPTRSSPVQCPAAPSLLLILDPPLLASRLLPASALLNHSKSRAHRVHRLRYRSRPFSGPSVPSHCLPSKPSPSAGRSRPLSSGPSVPFPSSGRSRAVPCCTLGSRRHHATPISPAPPPSALRAFSGPSLSLRSFRLLRPIPYAANPLRYERVLSTPSRFRPIPYISSHLHDKPLGCPATTLPNRTMTIDSVPFSGLSTVHYPHNYPRIVCMPNPSAFLPILSSPRRSDPGPSDVRRYLSATKTLRSKRIQCPADPYPIRYPHIETKPNPSYVRPLRSCPCPFDAQRVLCPADPLRLPSSLSFRLLYPAPHLHSQALVTPRIPCPATSCPIPGLRYRCAPLSGRSRPNAY